MKFLILLTILAATAVYSAPAPQEVTEDAVTAAAPEVSDEPEVVSAEDTAAETAPAADAENTVVATEEPEAAVPEDAVTAAAPEVPEESEVLPVEDAAEIQVVTDAPAAEEAQENVADTVDESEAAVEAEDTTDAVVEIPADRTPEEKAVILAGQEAAAEAEKEVETTTEAKVGVQVPLIAEIAEKIGKEPPKSTKEIVKAAAEEVAEAAEPEITDAPTYMGFEVSSGGQPRAPAVSAYSSVKDMCRTEKKVCRADEICAVQRVDGTLSAVCIVRESRHHPLHLVALRQYSIDRQVEKVAETKKEAINAERKLEQLRKRLESFKKSNNVDLKKLGVGDGEEEAEAVAVTEATVEEVEVTTEAVAAEETENEVTEETENAVTEAVEGEVEVAATEAAEDEDTEVAEAVVADQAEVAVTEAAEEFPVTEAAATA